VINVTHWLLCRRGEYFQSIRNFIIIIIIIIIRMRVRESLLPWESNTYYIFVCVCVRACMRTALLIQHSTYMRHIVRSFVAPLAEPYFSTLSYKGHDFREKKVIEHKILIFATTFV
jgi:hypothetical protein